MTGRIASVALAIASVCCGQGSQTIPGPSTVTPSSYIPGTTYQASNPNYMNRNPFWFEGRVDWNLLKVTNPSTPWEFVQRAIHEQDDLQDFASAIADYQQALSQNSLANGTCQILTVASANQQNVDPAPCMFTPRLRLAHLIKESNPAGAVALFQEVLQIDPLRLGVNAYIGDVFEAMAAASPASGDALFKQAISAYQAELLLSPVTPETTALTGDKANNEHVHWALSEAYAGLGDTASQAQELQAYLDAAQWHSDTYPWRITLAQRRLSQIEARKRPVTAPHKD